MIDCLIIGEVACVATLSAFFTDLPFTVAGTATSYEDGLILISQHNRCLVYIDIDFVLLNEAELYSLKMQCCFCILSNNTVEVDVLRGLPIYYLPKPITFDSFGHSLEAFGQFLLAPLRKRPPTTLRGYFDLKVENRGIKIQRFYHKQLLYIKADENYIRLYLACGTSYMSNNTLYGIAAHLTGNMFMRVHRSFIVNTSGIISIEGRFILLEPGSLRIPIGRKYVNHIKAHLSGSLIKKVKKMA